MRRFFTDENLAVLRENLVNGEIRSYPESAHPHLRRAINLALLEKIPGEQDAWRLTALGAHTFAEDPVMDRIDAAIARLKAPTT